MNDGNVSSVRRKPRILMITCQYPPDVYGGAEQQCRRVSLALQRAGYDVRILTSIQNRRASFDDGGLEVTRIYTGMPPDLLGRWVLFSIYWLVRCLHWGFLHRREFDVIHCHQGKFGGFVGCALGRLLRKPVLIKIGNSADDMDVKCLRRKWLFGPLCYQFVKRSNPLMVAITQDIERDLREDGWARRVHIPNGVSPELRPASLVRTPEPGIHLFYHGRIEAIKRVPVLVEAVARVNAPNVHLHIFGDGQEIELVRETIAHLAIAERVHVWGACSDVLGRIAPLDIFVNASRAEGFSNSLLEALLCEKVLVSTPVSGARDAIAEGVNGFVAQGDSAQALAVAIDQAIDLFQRQPELARQEARKKISERFAIDLVVDRYRELYAQMVQDFAAGPDLVESDQQLRNGSES